MRKTQIVCRFVKKFLKSLEEITDTFSFLNDLRTLNLSTNNVFMASFDIASLVTNVPLDETIEIVI